ncbi:nucleotidyltransferase family protein [Desulforhopalus vacuolatus]|uniref:nucleotidyltransferase domain-containing protein n=1 Tax=Desulforhopalus vacuolatus TaxID=40414 RepID=UPI0019641F3E|nr:nucleotidyltransferase family protein [Desulforhopalus vacuolatus]MBM9520572.1 nucleotidyltransferase family protein [Desulforhopalus vacuolatus]
MKRYPILEVCARVEGHEVQHQMLREYCQNFNDWQGLLVRAEREGMAPLLRKHILESEAEIPATVRRSLSLLYKRHKKQAVVRLKVLEDILQLFEQHQLTPILLKGSALCLTLYPDPALRPMRDMDILFSRAEVDKAQGLLRDAGFEQANSPIPPDHHHLPALHKTIDDIKVCFELHRGLYPNCPPYYPVVDFYKLMEAGQMIQVGEVDVLTFSHEETLHYLYQHALRAPLTYESYKLINIADIIGYTEKYIETLEWQMIQKRFPLLFNALPLMQHVSPWNRQNVSEDIIASVQKERTVDLASFNGWPHRRLKDFKANGIGVSKILKETFLPSIWWTQIYYGKTGYRGYLNAVALKHPRHILWWKRLYSSLTG